MYKTFVNGIDISIELEPGVYRLNTDSGHGKTYLGLLLTDSARVGEPVATVDYIGGTNKLVSVIGDISGDAELIMIDRCDMYPDECEEVRQALQNKQAIILVALNGRNSNMQGLRMKTAEIVRTEHQIRVGQGIM